MALRSHPSSAQECLAGEGVGEGLVRPLTNSLLPSFPIPPGAALAIGHLFSQQTRMMAGSALSWGCNSDHGRRLWESGQARGLGDSGQGWLQGEGTFHLSCSLLSPCSASASALLYQIHYQACILTYL